MSSNGTRPPVLLITRNLPPLVGGMERLLLNASTGIADYTALTVIGPRGCREHLPGGVNVHEVPSRLGPFLLAAAWRVLRLSARGSWDVMLGGSGLVAPLLLLGRSLTGCRTMILLHGLDVVVDNRLYQALFLPCIRRIDRVVANSESTRRLAQERGVPDSRMCVINPGTSLPPLATPAVLADFRSRHGIPFDRYLLFVGRLTRRKGLAPFLRCCLPRILREIPGCGLVVVGQDPAHSLNRLGEEHAVMHALAEADLGARVHFLGTLSDEDLLACYTAAALQVFPLVDVPGDVEGFGMVAVEAAACGTPTVAFRLGGVTDAVCPQNGRLVPPGDYAAFAAAVVELLHTGKPDAESCREFARQFEWERYHEKFRDALAPFPDDGSGAWRES